MKRDISLIKICCTKIGPPQAKGKVSYLSLSLTIVCFLAVGALVWFNSAPGTVDELAVAREAGNSGKYDEAFSKFDEALKKAPDNKEIPVLIRETVEEAVKKCLDLGEVSKAKELYSDSLKRFPHIDGMEKAETRIVLAESFELFEKGKLPEMDSLLADLAKSQKNSPETLLEIGKFYDKTGHSWSKTISYLHAAAEAAPKKYADHPIILKNFDWFLKNIKPGSDFEAVRNFIAKQCFSYFENTLEEGLYSPGENNQNLRLNAKAIYEKLGKEIDSVKLNLLEILDCRKDNDRNLNKALDYFLTDSSKKISSSLAIERCYLFETGFLATGSKLLKAFSGPLFPTMEAYLKKGLAANENPKHFHRRTNSFQVFLARKEISEVEIWNFHFSNLGNLETCLNQNDLRSPISDSLNYLGNNPIPVEELISLSDSETEVWETLSQLRQTLNELVQNQLPKNIEATKAHGFKPANQLWRNMLAKGVRVVENLNQTLEKRPLN